MARGFHTTLGVANTDLITSALATNAVLRSRMIQVNIRAWPASNLSRLWGQEAGPSASYVMDEILLRGASDDRLWYVRKYSTTDGVWSIAVPSLSTPHTIIVTRDESSPSNAPVFYVDGTTPTVTPVTAPVGTPVNTGLAYRLGNLAANDFGVDTCFDGTIQEFAVWDRILTSAEATALAGGTNPKSTTVISAVPLNTNLVEYIPMLQADAPVISCLLANPTVIGTLAAAHSFASLGCAFTNAIAGGMIGRRSLVNGGLVG
jgi:hypothetical protein